MGREDLWIYWLTCDYADAFMANPDVLGHTYKSFSIFRQCGNSGVICERFRFCVSL